MVAPGKIRRVPVQRYNKSGKLAAIYRHDGYVGYAVLELSPGMDSITNIRNPKFLKSGTFSPTKYEVEIEEKKVRKEGNITTFNYRFVRILAPEDTDLHRWMSTESLGALPVSPEEGFTLEERAWAGEREGNLTGGIVLGTITIGTIMLSITAFLRDSSYLFFALIAVIAGWFFFTYPWKVPRKSLPIKLDELKAHKENLRRQAKDRFLAARTAFEKALEDFSTWERLSPQNFEAAVSRKLEREGFKVKTTQYSRDGGVDVEAIDNQGAPVIVQAKRYKKKVGVAVVREMIGVRESRPDRPRTIIYALVGFTRGAQQLAEKSDIELRDVRTELLHI